MKKIILLLLSVLFVSAPTFGQVEIYGDPEKSSITNSGAVGVVMWGGTKIVKYLDSCLFVMYNNDIGNDCGASYSTDGGGTWTSTETSVWGVGQYYWTTVNSGNDTVYVGGTGSAGNARLARSWYNGSWIEFDTVGASGSYSPPYLFPMQDTICASLKTNFGTHDYGMYNMTGGFDNTSTWNLEADTWDGAITDQGRFDITMTSIGALFYVVNTVTNTDETFISFSDAVFAVVGGTSIADDYNSSTTYGYLGAFVDVAGDVDHDTVAFAVNNADSIFVIVGTMIIDRGEPTWAEIRQVTVVPGGRIATFDATDEQTWAFPTIQWDEDGALRLYCKDWADTSDYNNHGISLYESTDYGATWGSRQTLLAATGTDEMTNLQTTRVSSAINDGQVLRSVMYCNDGLYGSNAMNLYIVADTIDALVGGGPEPGGDGIKKKKSIGRVR